MTKPPPQGVCPVVGLLGHRVVLLFFKEPPYCSGVQPSNSGLFFFFRFFSIIGYKVLNIIPCAI